PLKGNIVIELASNVGFAIIDRLLGGMGEKYNINREFTEIELTILERIFDVFVNLLKEPWANVVNLDPRLVRIETNSQFAQIIDPNEMIAIITLNLTIGKIDGMMNICLPYSCLEEVIEKINTRYWYTKFKEKDEGEYTKIMEAAIGKTK